jgi:hypothetical protein
MPDLEGVSQYPIYIRNHSESFALLRDKLREELNHNGRTELDRFNCRSDHLRSFAGGSPLSDFYDLVKLCFISCIYKLYYNY